MDSLLEDKIKNVLDECNKHIKRLNYASKKMSGFMPLDVEKYENLTDDEVAFIDQFLYRFLKLQDTIGQKLFRYILIYLEEDIEGKAFIDILNILEKLNLIDSANKWKILRRYRNELAHNYENDPKAAVELINVFYQEKAELEKIFFKLEKVFKNKN